MQSHGMADTRPQILHRLPPLQSATCSDCRCRWHAPIVHEGTYSYGQPVTERGLSAASSLAIGQMQVIARHCDCDKDALPQTAECWCYAPPTQCSCNAQAVCVHMRRHAVNCWEKNTCTLPSCCQLCTLPHFLTAWFCESADAVGVWTKGLVT